MSPLVIAIAAAASLVIIPLIVAYMRNAPDDAEWLKQNGTQVIATVTDVQTKQDWKYGERWYRDPWDGILKRDRTWQTCYDCTAQWIHPRTKQVYTFRSTVWAENVACKPVAGNPLSVIVNRKNPRQYSIDFQCSS